MKMTEKTKRRLAVGGGIAICAGLLAAIGLRFAEPPAGEDVLPESGAAAVHATPSPAVGSGEEGSAELAIPPVQADQPDQSIQPEVEKPPQPDGETLTDPGEKPDGTKVETAPEPVDHETYVPPADDGGGNGGGGLPGFDYVPNKGENNETFAGDMYENGNKIGSMD